MDVCKVLPEAENEAVKAGRGSGVGCRLGMEIGGVVGREWRVEKESR